MHIYRVTNLDASGPGSLIDGLRYQGTDERWIVFHVSGTIVNTQAGFAVENAANVRVFGNTSAKGIQITGYPLGFLDCSNIEIRHLAFSLQSAASAQDAIWWDPLKVNCTPEGTSRHVRFMHCSIRGGNDENDIAPSRLPDHNPQRPASEDVRFEHCLFAHSWRAFRDRHNFSLMFTKALGAVVRNCVFAHANRRSPQIFGQGFVLGNLVYNYGSSAVALLPGKFDVRDNAFLPGSGTRVMPPIEEPISCEPGFEGTASIFLSGNKRLASKRKLSVLTDWKIFRNDAPKQVVVERLESSPFRFSEHQPPWLNPTTPQGFEQVLDRAGTIFRDRWDREIIADIRNQTGQWVESEKELGGIPQYTEDDSPVCVPTSLSEHELLEFLTYRAMPTPQK